MDSKDVSGEPVVDNVPSVDVVQNDHSGDVTNESSQKITGAGDGAPAEKKQRRSSGRKSRCDIDIMEEARAAYGELDASEGRSLRKRPEPPKVEKTPPAQKRRSGATPGSRKKGGTKQKEEESAETPDDVKVEAVPEKPLDVPVETDDVKTDEAKTEESAKQAAEQDGKQPEPEGGKVADAAAEPAASASIPETATPTEESDQKTAEPQASDEAKKDGSE